MISTSTVAISTSTDISTQKSSLTSTVEPSTMFSSKSVFNILSTENIEPTSTILGSQYT